MRNSQKRVNKSMIMTDSSIKKTVTVMIETMVNDYRQTLLNEISNLSSPTKVKPIKANSNSLELIPSSTIAKELNITAQGMAFRCKSKKVSRVKKNNRWFIKKNDIAKLK